MKGRLLTLTSRTTLLSYLRAEYVIFFLFFFLCLPSSGCQILAVIYISISQTVALIGPQGALLQLEELGVERKLI